MSKEKSTWYSQRVGQDVTLARWGSMGAPVLIFPTAGGDAEEIERFHLIDAISDLLGACRAKAYSVDSVAGQAWLAKDASMAGAAKMQNRFDELIVREIVPAIRQDCGNPEQLEIVVAGASIGAFNALAAVCRHPDVFAKAICMSGSYDLRQFLEGPMNQDFVACSPLHFLPDLPEDDARLRRLRERFVLLTHGQGRYESPENSWKVADALGKRRIPNRVDAWDKEWNHDWVTWRAMLPKYLDELLP